MFAVLPVFRRRTVLKLELLKTIGEELLLVRAKPASSAPFNVTFSGDPASFWIRPPAPFQRAGTAAELIVIPAPGLTKWSVALEAALKSTVPVVIFNRLA